MKFSKKLKKNAGTEPESRKGLWLQLGVGILFSKGEKYLVYAYEDKLDGKVVFMTDICAGTARYANAKEDMEYLETPARFPELRKLDPPNP